LSQRLEASGLSRREFLAAGGALAAWPLVGRAESGGVAGPLVSALETSEFAYISPRKSDGAESTCHGEVWYGWLAGTVVIITSTESWKVRALKKGLHRARIWVGDHGRWNGLIFRNEDFRNAPSFEAQGSVARDTALLDQLLALYETKYPAEIADWRDRMRGGYADGSRVLIRYTPAG
jgi:hypothetical protein